MTETRTQDGAPGADTGGSGDEARGFTAPGFESVRETLAEVGHRRGEDGCALAAYVDGSKVVDLWWGSADGKPWAEDTLAVMFSSTKGATALCAQILYSRGLLDLDAPVTRYWPEYGQAGKDSTHVHHLLTHTAGVVSFPRYWEVIGPDGLELANWELIVDRLAAAPPSFEPGSRAWYHALTYGYLVGEVIRRIDGRMPGRFFAEEVAQPLGLDFHIGAPDAAIARVASVLPAPPVDPSAIPPEMRQFAEMVAAMTARAREALKTGTGIEMEALLLSATFVHPDAPAGADQLPALFNQPEILRAELPAGNGVASARDLARMYALLACGGELDGVRLVSPESIEVFSIPQVTWEPAMQSFCLGYGKLGPAFAGPGEAAFGHGGAGGAMGFADPARRVGFGFVKNRMRNEPGGAAADLTQAVYACL